MLQIILLFCILCCPGAVNSSWGGICVDGCCCAGADDNSWGSTCADGCCCAGVGAINWGNGSWSGTLKLIFLS